MYIKYIILMYMVGEYIFQSCLCHVSPSIIGYIGQSKSVKVSLFISVHALIHIHIYKYDMICTPMYNYFVHLRCGG